MNPGPNYSRTRQRGRAGRVPGFAKNQTRIRANPVRSQHGQVVYGLYQVRFALPIGADKHVGSRRKVHNYLTVGTKPVQSQVGNKHATPRNLT